MTHAKAPDKKRYRKPPTPAAASTKAGPESTTKTTGSKSTMKTESKSTMESTSKKQRGTGQSTLGRQPTSKRQPAALKQQSKSTRQPASKKRQAGNPSSADTRSGKRSKMDMSNMPPPPSVPLNSISRQTAERSAKAQVDSTSHQPLQNSPSAQTKTEGGEQPPTELTQESVAELKQHIDPALQVCRYLLEMFSVPLLRSHATVSLVDRDRLQFYHANRSVILVSSAINLANEESGGKDKFIASVLAFHCLTLEQNGIIGSQMPGLDNAELVKRNKFEGDPVVQSGGVLHFQKAAGDKGLSIILEDVVSREPAIVGRSTVVLNARVQGGGPEAIPLVVKVSWPTSGRVSETKFLEKACSMAKGKYAWATNHLPDVRHPEDVIFTKGSTPESIAGLFGEAELAGSFVYERRVLRIIVQERLVPLRYLPSVREIGQVFLDIACSTCDGFHCRPVFH